MIRGRGVSAASFSSNARGSNTSARVPSAHAVLSVGSDRALLLGQLGQSGRRRTRGERQEPGAFHAHALAHQARFAEYMTDRREFARVSAVEG